jgi:3-deoxy-7-phosphoheptulonate synthase
VITNVSVVEGDWSPTSWQAKTATQQPAYPDRDELDRVVAKLARFPPLVTSWEIENLKKKLARAALGEMFLLQGGDCAESFEDCDTEAIVDQIKVLLQMSLVLVHGTKLPVILVGRIAGQYAKPRSSDEESRNGVTLPAYRGDLVNRSGFTPADRTPDPQLLIKGYERAALTLNFLRALSERGFFDLYHPEYWNLGFVQDSPFADEYQRIVESIQDSMAFLQAVTGRRHNEARRLDLHTSHEGLALHYEQAMTRQVPRRVGWYDLTTHFPWIGMRTAQLDGGHVEYFRGIKNPIGVKVGPAMTPEWLLELIDVLNPEGEPGRLTLIHRMGAGKVAQYLPPLIEAVERRHRADRRRRTDVPPVVWCCDPMHGNTETTADGIKTRRFDKILGELEQAFEVHARMGTILGGVHFELTGEYVTECVGGASGLTEEDLRRAYRSQVDPRLNYEQALEMAMQIARHVRLMNRGQGRGPRAGGLELRGRPLRRP